MHNIGHAVVTGGAGFVGHHLCAALIDYGFKVTSVDNYSMGTTDNHVKGVNYINGATEDLPKLITFKPDTIFHFGEYSRVSRSLQQPEITLKANIAGIIGVLGVWRDSNCRLIYAGSSSRFRKPLDAAVNPEWVSPYTSSKSINAQLISNYSRWYGLDHTITYLYNLYGPMERSRENAGTLIQTFADFRRRKQPLKIHSPGSQKRAFTHVEDAVRAIILIAQRGEKDSYFVCSHDVYSINEVAQFFGGATELAPGSLSPCDHMQADTSELLALGWRPRHSLREYIDALRRFELD